ncbi:MAG: ABC transporter substrate-binding protein [Actinobacteria bacterium HGW-Actinobacteria-1]|jgi:peptide/nickel transport system substrate-binding protein/oligopeptide transport system substrate-binding protein|nr:MAG: ABC transporter substrate-binding protein [Actinobacteria bacterium HGW-Actinobacteria-1]
MAVALALVMVVAVAGLGGCKAKTDTGTGTDTGSTGATKGGTLSFYINEPAFIDPVNAQESEGMQVVNSVFDSLVDFDPATSEIMPSAAESWEGNADASVWTFKLRKGAKFHNGREVTAQDFKYAWERICNPENKSEISYHLAAVKGFDEMAAGTAKELSGVKVVDDYTLEVTLSYPFGDFEYVVGHPALGPVPAEELDTPDKVKAFLDMPIGNGPFKMAEPWSHNQGIKVVRFDDYYGDTALLDGVDFKIFKDEETAFLEFKAGNLDFTSIPGGQIEASIQEYGESADGYTIEPGKQVLTGSELSTYYMIFNTKDATLKNADVRRAISMAINREAIVTSVYEGTRSPATGIVPKGIVGYQDGAWPYAKYDKEGAIALLEKAGYPGGKGLPEISLSFNSGSGHEPVMQLIQSDLKAIGVNVKLDGQEWAQYLDKLDAGEFQLGRLGWLADYPIMDNFLYPLFYSKSADNHSFYNDPAMDTAILDARKVTDPAARVEAYRAIEKTIGEAAPVAPIVGYKHQRVGSARIRDFVFSPMSLAALDKAWIETK